MRPSIRYPAGEYLYVSRGARPLRDLERDEVADHYRDLAQRLVEHDAFQGPIAAGGTASLRSWQSGIAWRRTPSACSRNMSSPDVDCSRRRAMVRKRTGTSARQCVSTIPENPAGSIPMNNTRCIELRLWQCRDFGFGKE